MDLPLTFGFYDRMGILASALQKFIWEKNLFTLE